MEMLQRINCNEMEETYLEKKKSDARKIRIAVLSIVGVIFLSLVVLSWRSYVNDQNRKDLNFRKQLGTYSIDLQKTALGDYTKDSSLIKNLSVRFNSDSTFQFNMEVPFIYDTAGWWTAAGSGVEEWNWLYYKRWGGRNKDNQNGDQFTPVFTEDSIFYMNSTTPKEGQPNIQKIYFRKKNTKNL